MIREAARTIISGGVVVYPTETVYGIGASALDEQAVMRVFQIKKRPLSMPIFLAISSLEMLDTIAEINTDDREILERLLPGPVSILVRKKGLVPDLLTAGSPLVGIRFPDHETARTSRVTSWTACASLKSGIWRCVSRRTGSKERSGS